MLDQRLKHITEYRNHLARRAKMIFVRSLKMRNYKGSIAFDHNKQELNLLVHAKKSTQLSGGERSYSMVALLLALWEGMPNPFRMIDEYDVCMDEVILFFSSLAF